MKINNMYCNCGCGQMTKLATRDRVYKLRTGEVVKYKKGQPAPYIGRHRMKSYKGEGHWNHKGDNAGYSALHLRVQAQRGKALICEQCESTKKVEWASLSKKYADISDYIALCKKCHIKFDNVAQRVADVKREKYSLSDIARKGWESRRRMINV